jgi:glutamate-1-semialdehyde 2,1-aminomutase
MAAGIAVMTMIQRDPAVYERIQARGRSLVRGLVDAAETNQRPMVAASIGGLAGIFFSDEEVNDYEGAAASDAEAYARFFNGMLEEGAYLPPSRFEALFISDAHTEEHVDRVVEAAFKVLAAMRANAS